MGKKMNIFKEIDNELDPQEASKLYASTKTTRDITLGYFSQAILPPGYYKISFNDVTLSVPGHDDYALDLPPSAVNDQNRFSIQKAERSIKIKDSDGQEQNIKQEIYSKVSYGNKAIESSLYKLRKQTSVAKDLSYGYCQINYPEHIGNELWEMLSYAVSRPKRKKRELLIKNAKRLHELEEKITDLIFVLNKSDVDKTNEIMQEIAYTYDKYRNGMLRSKKYIYLDDDLWSEPVQRWPVRDYAAVGLYSHVKQNNLHDFIYDWSGRYLNLMTRTQYRPFISSPTVYLFLAVRILKKTGLDPEKNTWLLDLVRKAKKYEQASSTLHLQNLDDLPDPKGALSRFYTLYSFFEKRDDLLISLKDAQKRLKNSDEIIDGRELSYHSSDARRLLKFFEFDISWTSPADEAFLLEEFADKVIYENKLDISKYRFYIAERHSKILEIFHKLESREIPGGKSERLRIDQEMNRLINKLETQSPIAALTVKEFLQRSKSQVAYKWGNQNFFEKHQIFNPEQMLKQLIWSLRGSIKNPVIANRYFPALERYELERLLEIFSGNNNKTDFFDLLSDTELKSVFSNPDLIEKLTKIRDSIGPVESNVAFTIYSRIENLLKQMQSIYGKDKVNSDLFDINDGTLWSLNKNISDEYVDDTKKAHHGNCPISMVIVDNPNDLGGQNKLKLSFTDIDKQGQVLLNLSTEVDKPRIVYKSTKARDHQLNAAALGPTLDTEDMDIRMGLERSTVHKTSQLYKKELFEGYDLRGIPQLTRSEKNLDYAKAGFLVNHFCYTRGQIWRSRDELIEEPAQILASDLKNLEMTEKLGNVMVSEAVNDVEDYLNMGLVERRNHHLSMKKYSLLNKLMYDELKQLAENEGGFKALSRRAFNAKNQSKNGHKNNSKDNNKHRI